MQRQYSRAGADKEDTPHGVSGRKEIKMAVRSVKTALVLAICIMIPLAVGSISSMLVGSQFAEYAQLTMPPGSPAPGVFPIVWTVLYIMIGVASFLFFYSSSKDRKLILALYGIMLILNFLWTPVFFGMQMYGIAAIIIALMFVLTIFIAGMAMDVNAVASWLFVPYGAWCVYAMYLNIGVIALN